MQGVGRLAWPDVLARARADLGMCEALLADGRAYLTGDTPTLADCFLFGFVDVVR